MNGAKRATELPRAAGRNRWAGTVLTVLIPAAGLVSESTALAQAGAYSAINLGLPPGATSAVGVRMNNAGDVAGWSAFPGSPGLKGWTWTQPGGFTVLPTPPGLSRYRAMDISDTSIVAGDGGFDSGQAWRLENGVYTILPPVDGQPISYLGRINDAGDIAGTATDTNIATPDRAFLAVNGAALLNLTPAGAGRATDLNNAGQVVGYTITSVFSAFRWDATGGLQTLGTLGTLAHSFANAMNDSGTVVGEALSATANTSIPFVFTDASGMQPIPAPTSQSSAASGINSQGHVVGTTKLTGPDLAWLWIGGPGVTDLNDLLPGPLVGAINLLAAHDINDAGQILAFGFDNQAGDFRTVLLTPVPTLYADIDGNGVVDLADHRILTDCMTGPRRLIRPLGCSATDFSAADLDGNGHVDTLDAGLFGAAFVGP
ncbi:MAG: hypothetical protein ACE5GE_05465 [Phycisphaerae bacterium]